MQQAGPLRVEVVRAGMQPLSSYTGELVIIRCAQEIWGAESGIHWRQLTYDRIQYICDGACFVRSPGRDGVIAGPGSLVLIPKGTPFQTWVCAERDMQHYLILLYGHESRDWFREIGVDQPTVVTPQGAGEIERLFDYMLNYADNASHDDWQTVQHYMQTVLDVIRHRMTRSDKEEGKAAKHYHRCRELMEQNYLTATTFREIAAACKLNEDYLTRLFRRFSGESGAAYLKRLRLSHAAELLLHSDRTVGEIAAELNYSDTFAFSKAFKQHFHVAPTLWRQQFDGNGATGSQPR